MTLTNLIDTELNREIGRIHWTDTKDARYYSAFLYGMFFGNMHYPRKRYDIRAVGAALMEEFERDFNNMDVTQLPDMLTAYESLSWSGHKVNEAVRKQAEDKYYSAWLCGERKRIALSAIVQDMLDAKKAGILAENKCSYLELELKHWEQQILEYGKFVDPNSNSYENVCRAIILMIQTREMESARAKTLQEKLIEKYLMADYSQDSPELLSKKLKLINAIPYNSPVMDSDAKEQRFRTMSQCILMHPKSSRFLKHLMRFNLTDTMDEIGVQIQFCV